MTVSNLRVPASGPPLLFNGVPVEIGSGFATRSDKKWSNGPLISVPATTQMILYGASPAAPLLPLISEPSPELYYDASFSFFYEHAGAAELTLIVEFSIDGGFSWITPAPNNSVVLVLNANTMIQHATQRFLGSSIGVTDSTPSLRCRLNLPSDNNAAYVVAPVRWGTLTEYLP